MNEMRVFCLYILVVYCLHIFKFYTLEELKTSSILVSFCLLDVLLFTFLRGGGECTCTDFDETLFFVPSMCGFLYMHIYHYLSADYIILSILFLCIS